MSYLTNRYMRGYDNPQETWREREERLNQEMVMQMTRVQSQKSINRDYLETELMYFSENDTPGTIAKKQQEFKTKKNKNKKLILLL